MEEYIKRVVKYILEKKYPEVLDVFVTKEIDMQTYIMVREKNYIYNVFLVIGDTILVTDEKQWVKLKNLIKSTLISAGIKEKVNIYSETPDFE